MSTYLIERSTIKADQTLHAISNPPQEQRRGMGGREPTEESSRNAKLESKIKYEQGKGYQFFVHKRRLFWVSRTDGDGHQYIGNRYKRAEELAISCLGRSTEPIKALLEEVFHSNKDKEKTLTIIRRPYTGGYASRLNWSRLTSKPRRALHTVVLEATQKDSVIADVEEYMDEATSAFYGSHGIPYRRGYLFHGPPGTGKTSLALALASKFNLDVYVLTLLDQDIGDSDLISLLNQLPGRSLLLLEDIDTAGLSNRKSKSKPRPTARRRPRGGTLPLTSRSDKSKTDSKADGALDTDDDDTNQTGSRVSLSGLLNAIDGVAAPEGHILIMTTNKPYELDDALVRAGRISVRVQFSYASRMQAEEIFRRMYTTSEAGSGVVVEGKGGVEETKGEAEELVMLAKKFAEALPEKEYSPADLQDYLLVHKKDPKGAVEELGAWMEKQREEKERKEEEKEADRAEKRERKVREEEKWKEGIREIVLESSGKGEEKVEGGAEGKEKVEENGTEKLGLILTETG